MKNTSVRWLAIGLVTLLTALAYGPLLPQLGFYRDDWYLLLTAQSQGTPGILALFQIDRPLVGYFYAIGYRLFGLWPLAWHVAALLMRLAGNLAFLALVRTLWPARPAETLAMAMLFSVYPGFTVQPNAGVYITDLAASAGALLSILLMLVAVGSARRWVWIVCTLLAAALELFYLGIFESAIGLEAARAVILGYIMWRRGGQQLKATFARALRGDMPYLVIGAAFLVWRLFIFQSSRRSTNLDVLVGRYSALPAHSILSIMIETIKDIVETVIFAWIVPFYQFVATSNYRDLAIAVVLALIAAGAVLAATRGVESAGRSEFSDPADGRIHPIWLGIAIVFFALLPIDLAGRNILFTDQWDRYTIYASAGAALAVGGFVTYFFDGTARKAVLLSLVGMSVVVHYFSAASYRDSWTWQRDLWQQLVWRAPGIESGTMLFVILPPAGYEEGYEIYGPANMIYFPGDGAPIGGEVLNSTTAANLELQKNRQHYDRSQLIDDNYRNALIMVFPGAQSCLHVLDGRKVELPGLMDNSLVTDVASYSRLDRIDPSAPAVSLPPFLGGGPKPAWCEAYEKMDLARQAGRWQDVARLADEAQTKGLTPEDVSEWMPALEAYATLGRLPEARHAASIIRSVDKARAFLCLQLQRGPAYSTPYDYNHVNQILCQAP